MVNLTTFDAVYDGGRFSQLIANGLMIDIDNLETMRGDSVKPEQCFWGGKRVLITGLDGMVGSTLADQLIELGAETYGTVKRHAVNIRPNIQHNIDRGKLKVFEADLCDYGRTSDIVRQVTPHVIFHQAAESFVPTSLQQPSQVVENNCVSTTNVLDAATKFDSALESIQLACSSEEYGFVKSVDELPISEERELRPTSTYAVTKVFTEYIGKAYYYMHRTPTVMTRCFNQEGPRRGPQFFTARIAQQVRDILDGKAKQIIMGNPNSVRDFTHVYDSCRAQILAAEKGGLGEVYNICSGRGITTGDYARLALRLHALEVPIMIDRDLLRSYERGDHFFDGFIGDCGKFKEKTGWRHEKGINDIIMDGVESLVIK